MNLGTCRKHAKHNKMGIPHRVLWIWQTTCIRYVILLYIHPHLSILGKGDLSLLKKNRTAAGILIALPCFFRLEIVGIHPPEHEKRTPGILIALLCFFCLEIVGIHPPEHEKECESGHGSVSTKDVNFRWKQTNRGSLQFSSPKKRPNKFERESSFLIFQI